MSREEAETLADTVAAEFAEMARISALLADQMASEVAEIATEVRETFARGGKLLFCGNGGSAADAQHLATEYVVRFRRERAGLPAIALTTDTSLLTAVGNDYGFDQIFARQVEVLGTDRDLLFIHSTSGRSENLIAACRAARDIGLRTVALLAGDGGEVASLVDRALIVPTSHGARAQEMHLAIGHVVCGIVERSIDCLP